MRLKLYRVLTGVGVAVACGICAVTPSSADDWPHWLGASRNSTWNEVNTIDRFPEAGPEVRWSAPVALGYSGPAVADGRVFVMDFVLENGDMTPNPGRQNEVDGIERVLCLSESDGSVLWKKESPCQYKISYPNGPRATPSIDGERVYTLGAEGHLQCLDCATGDAVWARQLKKDYGLDGAPFWGFAAHPLVDGDTLYCLVGGEGSVVVAFDKMTGEEKWKALSAPAQGYCPPTLIEAGGTRQLIVWHPRALNGLNPETGEIYWSVEMQPAYDMSIIAPLHSGNHLLATALQGTSVLLELDATQPQVREVWREKGPHPDHNPPLIVDGAIFGVDVQGQLRCFDLESGERLWESLATCTNGRPANSTTGFIVRNRDKFFIMTEQGELIIARMDREGYEELDRAKLLEPTARTGNRSVVWSHPAFANGHVFARNDKEIVCVSLTKK